MSEHPPTPKAFNPYHEWLGIPEHQTPPTHYRLLGLENFESAPTAIANGADRAMAFVRTFQMGKHSADSQRLLNELAAARVCLLNADRKAAYDESLRQLLFRPAATALPSPPIPTPPPLPQSHAPLLTELDMSIPPESVLGEAILELENPKQGVADPEKMNTRPEISAAMSISEGNGGPHIEPRLPPQRKRSELQREVRKPESPEKENLHSKWVPTFIFFALIGTLVLVATLRNQMEGYTQQAETQKQQRRAKEEYNAAVRCHAEGRYAEAQSHISLAVAWHNNQDYARFSRKVTDDKAAFDQAVDQLEMAKKQRQDGDYATSLATIDAAQKRLPSKNLPVYGEMVETQKAVQKDFDEEKVAKRHEAERLAKEEKIQREAEKKQEEQRRREEKQRQEDERLAAQKHSEEARQQAIEESKKPEKRSWQQEIQFPADEEHLRGLTEIMKDEELQRVLQVSNGGRIAKPKKATKDALQQLTALTQLHELDMTGDIGSIAALQEIEFNQVKIFRWVGCNIKNSSFKFLKNLPSLEELHLAGSQNVNFHGIAYLVCPQNLKELTLDGCKKIGDDGSIIFKKMVQLEKLHLAGCSALTYKGMENIKNLTQLKELNVSYHRSLYTGKASIGYLKNLKNIQKLYLEGTYITDSDLVFIKDKLQLEVLNLNRTMVTDAGIESLKELKQLKILHLQSTPVTNAGLIHLKSLTQLKELHIWLDSKKINDDGMVDFRKALPNCRVFIR